MIRTLVCCLALFAFTATSRAGELDKELAPVTAKTAVATSTASTGSELDRESPQQDYYRHGHWGGYHGGWGWGHGGYGYRPYWGSYYRPAFSSPYLYSPFRYSYGWGSPYIYRSVYTGYSPWYGFYPNPYFYSPYSYAWYW